MKEARNEYEIKPCCIGTGLRQFGIKKLNILILINILSFFPKGQLFV